MYKEYEQIIANINKNVEIFAKNNNLVFYALNDSFYYKVIIGNQKNFKKITINHKNKKRILFEPFHDLKLIQKYILKEILYENEDIYKLNKHIVKGFLKNSSIIDNAEPHLNKKVLIKMDIKDFFNSITRKRIFDIFKKYNKFSYETSYLLSKLVTVDNILPQGAPTSPFLANICAKGIDAKINLLLAKISNSKKITINYTRYADDITISLSDSMNYDYIINALIKIIESEGFTPNYRKTKVIKQSQSQLVTNILVNHKELRIQKKELKKISFILYMWENYSINHALMMWNKYNFGKKNLLDNESSTLIEILQGKISFFRNVNIEQSKNLFDKFNQLTKKHNVGYSFMKNDNLDL